MNPSDGKKPKRLKIAKAFSALVAVVLLGSVFCSRNNPLDPKAGNYDPGVNLLIDPGFENQDTVHWRGAISGGRTIDSSVSHSGRCSERIDMIIFGWPRAVWQTVTVVAGTVYTFSGWMKTDSINFGVHMMVCWYTTVPNFIKADTLGSLTRKNDWTEFSRNYVAPSGALTAQIYLEGVADSGSIGTAWFDDLAFNSH